MGATANLAARLEALAEPNTVLVGPGTQDLARGRFEFRDLGRRVVKGAAEPIRVHQALAASGAVSRFEVSRAHGLTPLTGRDDELGLLVRRWERAVGGEGQVALLSGEPGIGKSRLAHALCEHVSVAPHTFVQWQCSPYHGNSPLYPVTRELGQSIGIDEDGVESLREFLERAGGFAESTLALLGELLSIEGAGEVPPEMTEQEKRVRTRRALAHRVEHLCEESPLLLVFEDLHWADATSLDLLDTLIERAKALPLLMLLTFRPEFEPPWTGESHVLLLALSRLSRAQSEAMVSRLPVAQELSEESRIQIVSRTDGVPLFLEELTQAVAEELSTDVYDIIPTTLRDSLTARLDRLGPAKRIAQVGATIGREFAYALLRAVAVREVEHLDAALETLERSGLITRRGRVPDAEYQFKHALIQDAAYAGLLREDRRALNLRAAGSFERLYPERAQAEPELLARHFAEAEQFEDAMRQWQHAVGRAVGRGASQEAANNAREGLQCLRRLGESETRDRAELELQTALAASLMMTDGWGAESTYAASVATRDLSLKLGARESLGEALMGVFNRQHALNLRAAAIQTCQELIAMPEEPYQMTGHYLLAAIQAGSDFVACRDAAERAVALGERITPPDMPYWRFNDPLSPSLGHLASTEWFLGHLDRSRHTADLALAHARELGRPYPLAMTLSFDLGIGHLFDPDAPRLDRIDELLQLADEYGFFLFKGDARAWSRYAALIAHGPASAAAACRGACSPPWGSRFATEAELASMMGADASRSLEILDGLLQQELAADCHAYESDIHRRKAELLRSQSALEAAEHEFEIALAVARRQKAKSWELRAALGLARMWRDGGERERAQEVLVPLYEWFTEGFDTPDLKKAKTLLDELS